MGKKMTHKAVMQGQDARTSGMKPRWIRLRETKLFWVSQNGTKYRKTYGTQATEWPLYFIDLETITELEE